MRPLEIFHEKTVALIDLLESKQAMNRDEKIATIERLIEERNQVIGGITAPYSSEDITLGIETVQLNEKVAQLLTREKVLIQNDMRKLNHKKTSTNKYVNPYANMTTVDGIFYDKRN